jgi:TonB family protein
MDVTLKEDGTVDQASLINGDPLLAEAAISAVKQWRYQALVVEGKPVRKFVVVVSFDKRGRVRF